jgi:TolB-like protein
VKLCLLGLLLGGASLLVSGAASAASVKAALLPIAVHSADEGSAYLSAGLAEMISARLEQSGGVSVILVPGQAVPTSDLEKAIEAGRAAGADFVVFGAFTQFGAGASLDVQCAAVNAESDARPRRIFVQSGTLGEIIPKLDDLAAKIARFMISGSREPQATAGAASSDGGELDEIRRRLDALERAVRSESAKPAEPAKPSEAARPPAAAAAPGAPATGATR